MADIKQEFGVSTNIPITLPTTPNKSARESNVVNNSTNKFLDAMVMLNFQTDSAVNSAVFTDTVSIYTYGSQDGTNYQSPATGIDAVVVYTPSNLNLAKVISVNTLTNYVAVVGSVASTFGGVLPYKWGIVVDNGTGTFSKSTSNFGCSYTGVYYTAV